MLALMIWDNGDWAVLGGVAFIIFVIVSALLEPDPEDSVDQGDPW